MSDFEENFEIPAASEVDPAAEFLAKEQAELGDIGEDLGIAPAAGQEVPHLPADITEPENDLFSAAPPLVSQSILGDDVNPFLADSDLTAGNDFQVLVLISLELFSIGRLLSEKLKRNLLILTTISTTRQPQSSPQGCRRCTSPKRSRSL